jgi:hypothetical protein
MAGHSAYSMNSKSFTVVAKSVRRDEATSSLMIASDILS